MTNGSKCAILITVKKGAAVKKGRKKTKKRSKPKQKANIQSLKAGGSRKSKNKGKTRRIRKGAKQRATRFGYTGKEIIARKYAYSQHLWKRMRQRWGFVPEDPAEELNELITRNRSIMIEKQSYDRELHQVIYRNHEMHVVYDTVVKWPVTVLDPNKIKSKS